MFYVSLVLFIIFLLELIVLFLNTSFCCVCAEYIYSYIYVISHFSCRFGRLEPLWDGCVSNEGLHPHGHPWLCLPASVLLSGCTFLQPRLGCPVLKSSQCRQGIQFLNKFLLVDYLLSLHTRNLCECRRLYWELGKRRREDITGAQTTSN